MSPRKVALILREKTPTALSQAQKLSPWLQEKSIEVFCEEASQVHPQVHPIQPKDWDSIELVVVLGGDGTYLRAVGQLGGRPIPIVGLHLGSLGFLTDNRVEDMFSTLEAVFEGKMARRARSVLNIQVKGPQSQSFLGLNDMVIERGDRTHLLNISLSCEGQEVTETKADGIIVSSPTGSTAYNLAAGGPLLHPEVRALVVTSICPHSLTTRPLIFPDDKEICLEIVGKKTRASLIIDGQKALEIHDQHSIRVNRHSQDHVILRKPSHNFFGLLKEKLKFGDRD